MRGLVIWLVTAMAVHAGFVPPDESRAPFRREALPVDSATLRVLAADLVTQLPSEGEGPPALRRAAQVLALALALDPANRPARDWVRKLEGGEPVPAGQPPGLSARGIEATRWLASPDAGEQAALFTGYLRDVLPGETEADQADWSGWVAGLEAFEDPPEPEPLAETDDSAAAEPEVPAGPLPKLDRVSVQVPVWLSGQQEVALTPLSLHAHLASEGAGQPSIRVEMPPTAYQKTGALQARIRQWIGGHFGKPGQPVRLHFTIPEATALHSRSAGAMPAAALMLVHAAFAGQEIDAAGGIVLAGVDLDGGLTLPPLFWETLRGLPDGAGKRLIVPTAAAEMLPAMLTLDQSEFFLDYQVLLASSLEEAIALAGGQKVPGLSEAEGLYREVREGKGTRSAGSYFAMAATRQKLLRAGSLYPAHASARLLALRGTSQWPRRLSREMYARELRAAIMPLEGAFSAVWTNNALDIRDLLDADARCRERLAVIENLCESVEYRDELHNLAFNTSKSLGSLAGQIRRNERDSFYAQGSTIQFARPIYRDFRKAIVTLTAAVGDAEDFPLPPKR